MHEAPLKRSVTAPDSSEPHSNTPVPSVTVSANALGSLTPGGLSRHRSASPYSQSRLHSPDSPRPSDLLCHKDVILGRSRSRSPGPRSSASSVQSKESSNSGLHIPFHDSEKGSTPLSRVYESTCSSLKSSVLLSSLTPSIVVSKVGGLLLPLEGYLDAPSQSYLSVDALNENPPVCEMDKGGSGGSKMSRPASSEDLNLIGSETSKKGGKNSRSVRKKFPGYVAAEVQRISRSDPGANTPHFKFPILRDSVAPALSIDFEDLERKLVIGDPDPSFHRGIKSPVIDHPDEVVLEQVGSFRVHHLRNDSLGELPRISTVEELSSPPPSSSETRSPKEESYSPTSSEISLKAGSPRSGLSKPIAVPSTVVSGGEITSNTVFLPGEYGRRQHSRAGARSRGNKNIGVPLRISTQIELKSEATAGAHVTPGGPPATPESPFTSISRERTKLKGAAQNSPSPLITFLSVIRSETGGGSRKPVPPGKDNPNWILPAPPLGATTAVCFAQAYGNSLHNLQQNLSSAHDGRPRSLGSMITDNETTLALSAIPSHVDSLHMHGSLGSIITDNQTPITALPSHMRSGHMGVESPSFQSVQKIILRDDRRLLSSQ